MPGCGSGHVDLRTASGSGIDDYRRAARQAGLDCLRQRHRVHLQCHAGCKDTSINWHFIAPGKPIQNAFVESLNGRMRDELLNETLFFDLDDARTKIALWVADYNGDRRTHR
jgi:transposase InsO family protein